MSSSAFVVPVQRQAIVVGREGVVPMVGGLGRGGSDGCASSRGVEDCGCGCDGEVLCSNDEKKDR